MTIMIGIDPHKATHTAVAIDSDEVVCGEFKLRSSRVQGPRFMQWADTLGDRVRVLGSGHSQKNDPNDARSIAIAALRSERLQVVVVDDHPRVLPMLAKRHRDMARLRTIHCSRLHALLGEMMAGGVPSEINVNKARQALDAVVVDGEVTRHRVMTARPRSKHHHGHASVTGSTREGTGS